MTQQRTLSAVDIEKLAALDTCTASNAIERLRVRPRNEGFVTGTAWCQFPSMQPMVGYAATARIRTTEQPMAGRRCYYDRMDRWGYVATVPGPRVMVFQDVDERPGFGAFVGEIHATIGEALHCIGCVTNGGVRDIPGVKARGFHLFAGNVALSHAYAHIIEFGAPVEIGGLTIQSGDLLHGDRHGVHKIPLGIAAEVPAEAARLSIEEKELMDFCNSPRFSLEGLAIRLRRNSEICDLPREGR